MVKTESRAVRVLLVDDHALFRESISRALAPEPLIRIQHCASIRDAMSLLTEREFDVVLLDHDLGNERASQFLPAAREAGFAGRVLIVTAWVSDTEARRLLRQGVAGIFPKEAPLEELIASIRSVAEGGGPTTNWKRGSGGRMDMPASPIFNERQRRVLRFVVEGLSNKEIAWRLQISESYVKAILQSLFQKTGVRTRGQLVRVAIEQYEAEF